MKSVEKKIFIGFFLISLVILTLTVVSLISMKLLLSRSSVDKRTLEILKTAEKLYINTLYIETGVKGYVISGDTSYLESYYKGVDSVDYSLEYLLSLNNNDLKYNHDLNYLKKHISDLKKTSEKLILAERTNQTDTVQRLNHFLYSKNSMDRIRYIIYEIEEDNRQILKNINSKNRKLAIFTQYGFIITGLATLIALISVFLIIRREFIRRKKVESQLKENSNRIYDLYNNAPCGYLSINKDSLVIDINDTLLTWLSFKREEVVNKMYFKDLISEESYPLVSQKIEAINSKNFDELVPVDIKYKNKLDGWFIGRTNSSFLLDKNNQLISTRTIVVDITQLKEAELNIKKLNSELESFSYSVSHDLRAPLRAIDGFAKIIVEDYSMKIDAEGNRLLNIIINNANKMSQLIDDLLDFSRIGRREVNKINLYAKEIFNEVLSEIDISDNLKININISDKSIIYADRSMFKVVINNLIANSIKYSSKVMEPILTIYEIKDEHNFIFCVEDNGVGFDMEFKNKLFEVFQRLHSEKEYEGTGVGLALVSRIVEKHGGKVWAESKPFESTKFYVSLPLNYV